MSTDQEPVCNESVSAEAVAAEDAVWAHLFACSPDVLEKMAQEAHEDYLSGRTEDFDPDTDDLFKDVRESATEE